MSKGTLRIVIEVSEGGNVVIASDVKNYQELVNQATTNPDRMPLRELAYAMLLHTIQGVIRRTCEAVDVNGIKVH